MKPLPASFFNRPAIRVTHDLIGCYLVRKRGNKIKRHMITETEAYDGIKDKASHASRGRTARNSIMFRPAGYVYVYFTYGMHWMFNIVAGPKDYPAAVLIRGLEGINGPARLTKKLSITGSMNGKKLGRATGLWVKARASPIPINKIIRTPRIGVDYAGVTWAKKKWRFLLKTTPKI